MKNNPPPALLCVGRIVKEMIHFPDQVKGPVLGSPPAYCSVAAARQGTVTGIVTKISPEFPEDLLQPIIRSGVDTTGIIMGNKLTASELIYDAQGNKEIRYPSMSDSIRAEDIPGAFEGSGLIYVCPMDEDVCVEDLAGVVAKGQSSAVDLGGYGGVHMSKVRRVQFPSLSQLAKDVSSVFKIVKASDEDAISIFGWDKPQEAARILLDCGPDIVVITLGKQGALVSTRNVQWHVPPVPGNAIDTTGGGDTFMAGFLSEYLRSWDPLQSGRWGCATAICVIEQSGGVLLERMPTREQVQIRVSHYY
ncbi:MAG: carbohydrate kinase family protein [Chloroflexi bacterium]|nr:MAG: carbohydrate kinase family protein [Chloroflexota bacterium]